MRPHSSDPSAAFRTLEQRLAARRFAAMDLRMRAVLAAIAVLLAGFVFWQIRVPLQGLSHFQGPLAVAQRVAIWLSVVAAAAGATTAWRTTAIAERVPGPEWLALPLPDGLIARHLLSEARLPALVAFPAALAVLVAAIGYAPALWIALGAVAFFVAWLEATRFGAAFARHAAALAARTTRPLPAMTRLLVAGGRRRRARRMPTPRWRTEGAAAAIARLDRRLSLRPTPERTRLAFAALFLVLSLVPWFAFKEPASQRAWSFAAFTLSCTTLGAWAIARVCGDPTATLRILPLPLGAIWRGRFVPMVTVLVAVALIDAGVAPHVPLLGRVGMLVTWLIPGLAIALLGLHYAITIAPQASAAENLYYAWLGVAVAGSLMVPLMGWGVLIAGLIHSTRRLRVWLRPEVVS